MAKKRAFRGGFTLIEVMVAVMIVSVVIAALLEMRGNTTQKFFTIKKMLVTNQYNSFLLNVGEKYGFERSSLTLYGLVDDFDLESDLRRRLKSIKVSIDYEELSVIDTNEYTSSQEDSQENMQGESGATGIIFEIGKTVLEGENMKGSLIRVRVQ